MVRASLLSVVLAGACPALSAAGDQGESAVFAEAAASIYQGGGATSGAFGGGVSGWVGLTPSAWVFVALSGESAVGGSFVVGEAVGGVVLALDFLRVVPFLDIGLGLDWVRSRAQPVVRLGLGADYLVTRSLSVGVAARFRPLFGDGEVLAGGTLRVGWRWGE